MFDRVFYVGAQDTNSKFTGYVPAKFLTLNGKPVADPAPGGSQVGYIYADGSDKYKTRGEVANPNSYLIVPADYTEQHARAFAAEIANPVGQALALHRMYNAFRPNGPQDLQTHRSGEFQKIPSPSPAPQQSQPAVPYLLEYLQYVRQRDGE